jgi:iduronate 2-sulfatase
VAIDNYKARGQPFFMAMGTHRPHLPWVYPKRFHDRIPADVPEAKVKEWPADVPHIGWVGGWVVASFLKGEF